MRVEVRSSGGAKCETCDSYPLLHTRELPLEKDLEPLLELELLRREARLAHMFLDAHRTIQQEAAEAEVVHTAEVDWLMAEREQLQHEIGLALAAAKVDVSRWRQFRRRRETRFAARIDTVTADLLELTRWPLTGGFGEPVVVDRS